MYMVPTPFAKRLGINGANFFVQGQNLFTFSPFRGNDPQTVFLSSLAPLRTMVAGVQLSF
jgi:TonB-dependent starch-binding outer membrane protein SusC